ncbi:metal-dependent transcriptional regulator [Ruminococcaceae bacterium OttesenSCG-928-L11]|nr:metal-dependent transcriptional regulator [Ruminococcaceae bacterium OttesenSCG-928-L11]
MPKATSDEKILREAGEDYLETILRLEDGGSDVRSIDVATEMGVSRPSVNKAIGVLKKAGMVEQKPYGRIHLTDLGRAQAQAVTGRHEMLKRFLVRILGVDPVIADTDACKMEHVVSEETMAKLAGFVDSTLEPSS